MSPSIVTSVTESSRRGERPESLRINHCFKRLFVAHDQRRSLDGYELLVLEISEQPRDGFPRRADDLGYLFMREGEFQLNAALGLFAPRGPFEYQAGHLFRRRARQAERADLIVRVVVIVAQV